MISFESWKSCTFLFFTEMPMAWFSFGLFLCMFYSSVKRSWQEKLNFDDHATWCTIAPFRIMETSMRHMHRELALPRGRRMLLPEDVRLVVKKKKALQRHDKNQVKWKCFWNLISRAFSWQCNEQASILLTSKPAEICCFSWPDRSLG